MLKVTPCGSSGVLHQMHHSVHLLWTEGLGLTLQEIPLGPQPTGLVRVLVQEAALQHQVDRHLIHNAGAGVGALLRSTRSSMRRCCVCHGEPRGVK